jgi:hypothetical protein
MAADTACLALLRDIPVFKLRAITGQSPSRAA